MGFTKASVKRVITGVVCASVAGLTAFASPAQAETDSVTGYQLYTNDLYRGQVTDQYITWGSGCSTRIRGHIYDRRADGVSVTYWRKFNTWPYDSGWRRLAYATTDYTSGNYFDVSQYFCDTAGAWVAFCFGNEQPPSNSTSSRCVVHYRQDNS